MVCMESVYDLNEFSDSICNAFRFEDKPIPAPAPASTEKVTKTFPGAVSNQDLVKNVTRALKEFGFGASNTLLTTSFCCDEDNRALEKDFGLHYGDNFSMGGLAGFPFGGVTSFGAMADHIPNDGSCLLIFGPHVGIDRDGNFGSVNRRGRDVPGACCGSACSAVSLWSAIAPRAFSAVCLNISLFHSLAAQTYRKCPRGHRPPDWQRCFCGSH